MNTAMKLIGLVGMFCVSTTAALADSRGYSDFIFTNNSGNNLIVQLFHINYDGSDDMVAGGVVNHGDQNTFRYDNHVSKSQSEGHDFELRIFPGLTSIDATVSSEHHYKRTNHNTDPSRVTCTETGTYTVYDSDQISYSISTDESAYFDRCTVNVTLNQH